MHLDSIFDQFRQLRLLHLRPSNDRQLEPVGVYVVQLGILHHRDRFHQQLRLLHGLFPGNHRQLKPVDIYIVQLVSIYLHDRSRQLRLLHIRRNSHFQLEPVDIYIVQLDSICLVERFC